MSENIRARDSLKEIQSPRAPDPPSNPWNSRGRRVAAEPVERRVAPRSTALEHRSWIGWWDKGNFVSIAANLLDISRAGVAVVADVCPPKERDVWFCLHPTEDSEIISGEVVSIGTGIRGRCLIRIAFWEPCPDRLFKCALYGPLPAPDEPDRPAT